MNRYRLIGRVVLGMLILLVSAAQSWAQLSQGGLPHSMEQSNLKSRYVIPRYNTKALDIEALLIEDEQTKNINRYSIFEEKLVDIRSQGVEIDLPAENGRMWLFSIESPSALSIQLYFKNFLLPPGSELFLFNEDYSAVYGAFTSENNNDRNQLMVADFFDREVTIEYFEPYDSEFEGIIELGSIGQGYKEIKSSQTFEDSEGYINVNSPLGEQWQNEKHSVCLFTFKVGTSGYQCSGALLNNSRHDGTPYFLTANHCVGSETSAGTVVAFFNFERFGASGELNAGTSLSGAQLLTTNSISDFTLLQLNDTPPASYQPYYAAWDATDDQSSFTAGIHHPAGNPKKISIDDSKPISYNENIYWQGGAETPPNSHWKVVFEKGQTAGGSSGSPLFSSEKRQIIGQLHGGSEKTDYYGKLSKSFSLNSSNSIGSYLDPDGLGIEELETGYYPPENLPDPQIYSEIRKVCKDAPVQLTGMSAFKPTFWSWSISPSTYTFLDGTNRYYRQPVVQFHEDGLYDITLTVSNQAGMVTRFFSNVISVGSNLALNIQPYGSPDTCLCDFDSIVIEAAGASDYLWQLNGGSESNFYLVNDTVNPAVIKMSSAPGISTEILLSLTGSHGTCSEELSYTLPLVKQNNDSAVDAIQVFTGVSETFSNSCASIEQDEPIPPIISCTGQNSWCDEYGNGKDIIENSVWFYFIPDADGKYEIKTTGMDNQIAVYDAATAADLFNGNYDLIGANDDFTNTDFNPKVTVTLSKGKRYYIQSDGSGGGVMGNFVFTITHLSSVSANSPEVENRLKIYPQPASDMLTIEYPGLRGAQLIRTEVLDLSGSLLYSNTTKRQEGDRLEINLSALESGVYIIRLHVDEKLFTEKAIKY